MAHNHQHRPQAARPFCAYRQRARAEAIFPPRHGPLRQRASNPLSGRRQDVGNTGVATGGDVINTRTFGHDEANTSRRTLSVVLNVSVGRDVLSD